MHLGWAATHARQLLDALGGLGYSVRRLRLETGFQRFAVWRQAALRSLPTHGDHTLHSLLPINLSIPPAGDPRYARQLTALVQRQPLTDQP